jgi:putative hemolysin
VLKPFSDRTDFMEARVSTEELVQMVEEAAETGALHEQASEIASRALEFDKLTLAEVVVPRNRIDSLPIDAPRDEIATFLLERRRSRILIYEGDDDNVIGYVSVKDIVSVVVRGRPIKLRELLRAIKTFPETVPAIEVLLYMRDDNQRIAIAVDEHGLLSGLVTFEDLVDELVGEVFEQEGKQEAYIELPDGSVSVRGDYPIRDINREMELELEEDDGVTTIGGLCNKLASGMANRGARLAAGHGVVLVVQDATPRAVRRVRIIPPEAEEEAAAEETEDDES